jgi:hypothetical protein
MSPRCRFSKYGTQAQQVRQNVRLPLRSTWPQKREDHAAQCGSSLAGTARKAEAEREQRQEVALR